MRAERCRHTVLRSRAAIRPLCRLAGMTPCPVCGQAVTHRPGPGRPRLYCGPICQRKAERQAAAERWAERNRHWRADIDAGVVEAPWWMSLEIVELLDTPR